MTGRQGKLHQEGVLIVGSEEASHLDTWKDRGEAWLEHWRPSTISRAAAVEGPGERWEVRSQREQAESACCKDKSDGSQSVFDFLKNRF